MKSDDVVELRELYTTLCETIPWPKPIPRPEEMTFKWSSRMISTDGRCFSRKRLIVISNIYQDEILQEELTHLMIHEIAHLIWQGHPPAFKTFLRSVGVAEEYVHGRRSYVSEAYSAVKARQHPPRYMWKCQGCGRITYSHRWRVMSCGHCDTKWNPRFQFVLVQD